MGPLEVFLAAGFAVNPPFTGGFPPCVGAERSTMIVLKRWSTPVTAVPSKKATFATYAWK